MNTKFSNHRTGGMLVIVTATLAIVAVIGVSMVALTQTSTHSELTANAASRAYYLAESGLRYAQFAHCSEVAEWEDGYSRSLTLAGGEFIELSRQGLQFRAVATAHPGTAMEARAELFADIRECIPFDPEPGLGRGLIEGDDDMLITQGTIAEGNIFAIDSDVTIKGSVDGDVIAWNIDFDGRGEVVTGMILAGGDVSITGGSEVLGDVHVNGNFEMGGGSIIHGNLFVRGWVDINGSIVRGSVHSCESTVRTRGNTTTGSIRAHGNVTVGNNTHVRASEDWEPIEIRSGGHIDSGANIILMGTADGFATALLDITGSGTALDKFPFDRPAAPICPNPYPLDGRDLPEPTDFEAGGENVTRSTTQDEPLLPGSYGTVLIGNDARLHLQQGSYFFEAISLGNRGRLYLHLDPAAEFDDESPESVLIFVKGSVSFGGDLLIYVSTDGETYYDAHHEADQDLARFVFLETHFQGTNRDAFSLGNDGRWFGAVYTTDGRLSVGNRSQLIGAYYSGGGHNISNASYLIHVPPKYITDRQ